MIDDLTKQILREIITRAFEAGRDFSKHSFVDDTCKNSAASKTLNLLLNEECLVDPDLSLGTKYEHQK